MNKMSIEKSHLKVIIAILLISLSACAAFNGTPASILDSPEAKDVLKKYNEDFIRQASHDVSSSEERNTLISKALIIMDTNYAEFINSTETNRKNKEMAADFIELSMNLAGAAVGSAGTKTILAAISAGVNGINGSIDKNYFYEKTYQSLVARMNADRMMVRARIVRSMTAEPSIYPWHTAINDLVEYYNAGTLLGAISSIQKEAGEDEHNADEDIKNVRYIPLSSLITEDVLQLNTKLLGVYKQFTDKNFDEEKLKKIKTNVLPGLKLSLAHITECSNLDASKLSTAHDVGTALRNCHKGVNKDLERNAQDRLRDLQTIERHYLESGILAE